MKHKKLLVKTAFNIFLINLKTQSSLYLMFYLHIILWHIDWLRVMGLLPSYYYILHIIHMYGENTKIGTIKIRKNCIILKVLLQHQNISIVIVQWFIKLNNVYWFQLFRSIIQYLLWTLPKSYLKDTPKIIIFCAHSFSYYVPIYIHRKFTIPNWYTCVYLPITHKYDNIEGTMIDLRTVLVQFCNKFMNETA